MACPSHTSPVFSTATRRRVVDWAVKELMKLSPDGIVVMGQSGIILGALLSDRLNIPLVVVRKQGEPTQAGGQVEQEVNWVSEGEPITRWVFVDDCIHSGMTIERASEKAHEHNAVATKYPIHILLYRDMRPSYTYRFPASVEVTVSGNFFSIEEL